jgi:hypothetical protein
MINIIPGISAQEGKSKRSERGPRESTYSSTGLNHGNKEEEKNTKP